MAYLGNDAGYSRPRRLYYFKEIRMMTITKRQNLTLFRAVDTFGHAAQKDIAIEEMSELIKEICKEKRHGLQPWTNTAIADEIADVFIMLNQLRDLYGIREEQMQAKIDFKIDRLQKRIEEVNNDNIKN